MKKETKFRSSASAFILERVRDGSKRTSVYKRMKSVHLLQRPLSLIRLSIHRTDRR